MRKTRLWPVFFAVCVLVVWAAAEIPKPEDFLGFKIGEDRKLADMHQIIDYFQRLDAVSSRVSILEVGKTTMGNPLPQRSAPPRCR